MNDERYSAIYATADGADVFEVVGVPRGYVLPPTLTLHRAEVGPVVFYWASQFGIDAQKPAEGWGQA
jgi:hypothetical protein